MPVNVTTKFVSLFYGELETGGILIYCNAGHNYPFQLKGNKVELLMNEVHPGKDEDVPDPWYGPEPGYHEVFNMIDTAADHIIAKYGQPGAAENGSIGGQTLNEPKQA